MWHNGKNFGPNPFPKFYRVLIKLLEHLTNRSTRSIYCLLPTKILMEIIEIIIQGKMLLYTILPKIVYGKQRNQEYNTWVF